MAFVIRVQTSQGMHRLNFSSKNVTFGELQTAINEKYNISPEAQVISRTPPNKPEFIENVKTSDKLTDIQLRHGSIIYLVMVQNQIESFKQKNDANKPQQNASHSLSEKSKPSQTEQKYQSTSNAKYQLKPLRTKKKGLTKKLDDLNTDENKIEDAGPKHVPFHEWIQERQKKFGKTQPWNIDPPKYDYKPVALGNQVNFSDLPSNAVIKRQEYRHIDVLSFLDTSPYQKFKSSWEKNSAIQKCAYLIGRYEMIENHLVKKKKISTSTQVIKKDDKLMCAKVYALYEPPQKGNGRGVKLLKDNNEQMIDTVIASCNMKRIGIVYTTLPRGGKKYDGDIFMSGDEIFNSARLQEKYKNQNTGFTKFATLITHIGTKEAECYMISDQGVAMIKNGLISAGTTSLTDDAKDNYGFMKVNVPPNKIYLPGVVNENKEIKQGEHFPPDALLVNIISTSAKKQEHIFNYVHFPSPQNATIDHVRQHLLYHKDKEFHVSLSDFNLLVYLTTIIDINLVKTVAQCVVKKQRLSDDVRKQLRSKLRIAVPGWN